MPAAAGDHEPRSVLVTGVPGPLVDRVLARLREHAHEVVLSPSLPPVAPAGDHDVVVHLAPGDHDALAVRRASAMAGTPELLAWASGSPRVRHLVLLSSALTYGAWPNNPVPLTEDSPLRPDPTLTYARQLAHVEEIVDDWRRQGEGRTVAVLRPALTLSADSRSRLVRALADGMGRRVAEDDPPGQFVHLDDVVSAVVLAVDHRLDGVYNVAPDGSIPGERLRALSTAPWRVRLPGGLARWVTDLQFRVSRGPIPPGLWPYTRYPWLVANDRLRAEGWEPTVTNEQAYVEGTETPWWAMLSPRRKQELALGAMVVAVVGLVAGVAWIVTSRVASRRTRPSA
jgi:nucleoside-diphosphate-sugar epimerase